MRRRLALAALLLASPAWADDNEILHLICRPDQPAMVPSLAFSIDFAAKDAIETTSGQRFTRTDTNLKWEGGCEKGGRKF